MRLKNTFRLAGLSLLLLLSVCAVADEEQDRAALDRIRVAYEEAINNGDMSKFQPYLAKDFSGVMVTGESVQSYSDLVGYWKKIQSLLGPGGSIRTKVIVDRTDLFGDIALSRGATDETIHAGITGRDYLVHQSWTAVLRRESGEWKVVRIHGSMDPITNVFVAVDVKIAKIAFGTGGLIVGFLLGLVMMMIVHRKR